MSLAVYIDLLICTYRPIHTDIYKTQVRHNTHTQEDKTRQKNNSNEYIKYIDLNKDA